MTIIITYDDAVINAVQPEVSAVKTGVTRSVGVDANLNQYTTDLSGNYSCSDVDGLTLWHLSKTDIEGLFIDAGAADETVVGAAGILVAPDGTQLVFWMQATSGPFFYMYVATADISATGVVAPPVLINYLRMQNLGLLAPVACFELNGPGTSLVLMTTDFFTTKSQFFLCPTLTDIGLGNYKGSHPGVSGITLEDDEGPTFYVSWSNEDAFLIGSDDTSVQDGSVTNSPVGFLAEGSFWFVMPKAWMQNGGSGMAANHAGAYPDGGVFRLPLSVNEYADRAWDEGEKFATYDPAGPATDAIDLFAPAPPWTEEYTRIYDGADNDGFLASYSGRPALARTDSGALVALFVVLDGNPTYADDVGAGEPIFYAKVRGYRWAGASWDQFDDAAGIVLRQGDLGFSGYNFNAPGSQNIFVYDGDIYLQICQSVGLGGSTLERSVLTKFGSLREIVPADRSDAAIGRVRLVPMLRRF